MQIRPEDFRHAWPHALGQMLLSAEKITTRLEQADAQTVHLLSEVPNFSAEVHALFDQTKEMQIAAHAEMQKSVTNGIQTLKFLESSLIDRYNEIERETKLLYMRRAEIEARERRIKEFENLGFFGKLFFSKGTKS